MTMLITCPVCGRTDRALTKTGKIRHHKDGTWLSFCEAGGMTVTEASTLTLGQIRKIQSRDA